ncbi:unnamed protein product [Linum tenue]|uniref:RCC1-like domain-containing protein n=1 Tax=Linum tenue TaxID=586396 RepID=A0AAV0S7J2_9ROSI|nr:unnamed protein product [Linum tenue]
MEEGSRREEPLKEEEIWSWGAGTDGQLGTGKLEDELLPQLLHLPSLAASAAGSISMLACGGAHVVALTSGGRVLTWGRGTSGQLGHGEMVNCLYPKAVNSLEDHVITHVSAGWSHSGFVSDGGCLFTCGDGSFGQLGHGDYSAYSTPAKVSYFVNNHVEQMACGMRHSLVLLKGSLGSQVYGFGSGKRGQLGISVEKIKSANLPRVTAGFEDIQITTITANGDHSASLSVDGKLYTWGRGFSGSPDINVPSCTLPSLSFSQVALGWNHALLLTDDGEVFMLGGNRHGVLSNTEKMMNTAPNHLPGTESSSFTSELFILSTSLFLCPLTSFIFLVLITVDGEVMTWGWGEHGQLGLGSTSDETDPCLVRNEKEAVAISRVYCGSGFTYVVKAVH